MQMDRRTLGTGDHALEVSALGLGCMGMTYAYGSADEKRSIATIHSALDLGITLLDTADMYGPETNERLVGRAIDGRRDDVELATKFGIAYDDEDRAVNGRPSRVRTACDASLERLGIEHIDLYYLHRIDPEVPIEETIGAMAELISAGKVRHIGISEAAPDTPPGHVEENAAAADIELTTEELERLDGIFPPGAAAGERYPEGGMKLVRG